MPTKAQYDTLLSSARISDDKAGSTKIRGAPYNFPYAGMVANGTLDSVGSVGNYWSSTAHDSYWAYWLTFDTSSVRTIYNDRYKGMDVRCIAP